MGLRLLVTGGAGFIGSNFIRYFLKAHPDNTIVNLDKLTYAGCLENLATVQSEPNYCFVRGDIADSALLESLFTHSFDVLVHFAAESHVDRSIADARDFIQTNVRGTYTLLETARRKKVQRFVHVSTDEVYGSLPPGKTADEEATLRPRNPYAASKAASDLLVSSFWQTYGFPAIITRCSNNYGPYQFPEKLIPLAITNALEEKRVPVYGDGMSERDWVYVEDHCRALDQILRSGEPGQIYNIGSGEPIPNLELVRRLLRMLGKSDDIIEFVMDRPGHDRRYALDTSKLRGQLNWRPAVGLDEGLARTVEWYRSSAEWVKRRKAGDYLDYYEKFYTKRRTSLAQL